MELFLRGPLAPATDLCFHDLDADGILDVLLSRGDETSLSLFRRAVERVGSRIFIPLESSPRDLVVLDVDRNGTSDVVAASSSALHFLKTTVSGGLEAVEINEQPGRAFQRMETGDFDGDGELEIALTDLAGSSLVLLSLGEDGGIESSTQQALHVLPTEIASADFDRDGVMDLVVTDQGFGLATVLLHPGAAGGGELVELPVGGRQTAVDTGDVDRDGSADVVLATSEGLWVFFGDGVGGFPRTNFVKGFTRARGLRLRDLDGDGATELVVALQGGSVVIVEGAGSENPRVRVELEAGRELRTMEIQDVDSDGRLDVIAAGGSGVIVFQAQAGGGFEKGELFVVGDDPRAIGFGDFNGDGLSDLTTADSGSRGLSILSGTGQAAVSFVRGDVDRTGALSLTDAVVILGGLFGGTGPFDCKDSADVNDDGGLNLSDAVYLLNHLFRGGSNPPPPFPEAAEDPTEDSLDCRGF